MCIQPNLGLEIQYIPKNGEQGGGIHCYSGKWNRRDEEWAFWEKIKVLVLFPRKMKETMIRWRGKGNGKGENGWGLKKRPKIPMFWGHEKRYVACTHLHEHVSQLHGCVSRHVIAIVLLLQCHQFVFQRVTRAGSWPCTRPCNSQVMLSKKNIEMIVLLSYNSLD